MRLSRLSRRGAARLRRSAAALAGAGVLALAPASGATARARATLPADLQTLLARAAHLRVAYEIVRSSTVLNAGRGFSETTSATQERVSPVQLAESEGTGATATRLRLVGGTVYLELPDLARVAHGRRWLRATPRQLGTTAARLVAQSGAGAIDAHAVASLLSGATSVRELGPSVVEGEPVTEFLATIQLSRAGSAGVRAGASTTVDVQLYLAADGLVRRVSIAFAGVVSETVELLSDTAPVAVHRPPARDVAPFSRRLVAAAFVQALAQAVGTGAAPGGVYLDVTAWDALARAGGGAAAAWARESALF